MFLRRRSHARHSHLLFQVVFLKTQKAEHTKHLEGLKVVGVVSSVFHKADPELKERQRGYCIKHVLLKASGANLIYFRKSALKKQ